MTDVTNKYYILNKLIAPTITAATYYRYFTNHDIINERRLKPLKTYFRHKP